MGGFFSSVLPPGLIDVLSALIPPVVVGAIFCTFVIQLLRKEMAPRRMDGSLASQGEAAKGVDDDKDTAKVRETDPMNETPIVQGGEHSESDGR